MTNWESTGFDSEANQFSNNGHDFYIAFIPIDITIMHVACKTKMLNLQNDGSNDWANLLVYGVILPPGTSPDQFLIPGAAAYVKANAETRLGNSGFYDPNGLRPGGGFLMRDCVFKDILGCRFPASGSFDHGMFNCSSFVSAPKRLFVPAGSAFLIHADGNGFPFDGEIQGWFDWVPGSPA